MNSSIKKSLVAAAVATALGTGSAYAIAPNSSFDFTFYEAGGSAQENSAFWAIEQLLQTSSIDIVTDATNGAPSNNYLIVTGTTNAAGSVALGGSSSTPYNVLFFYKFNGGSFPNGAAPFTSTATASTALLGYPAVSSITNATTTSGATSPATTPASPTYMFTAADSDTSNSNAPDFGLTDVEIALFNAKFNLNGVTALASTSVIKQDGIYLDVFAPTVTNAVFNGTSTFAHPKTSFTKTEVEGILAGNVKNWNQLYADDGTQMPSFPMWFLDRGSGSGTKASGNQYFLNYPGGLALGGYKTPNSVTALNVNGGYNDTVLNLSGGYQDVKEASTAAVLSDLIAANQAGDYAFAIAATQAAPALNQGGFGSNQYSFAKIDGIGIDTGSGADNINGTTSTKYTNVVLGKYDYAYQNSLNTRTSAPIYTDSTNGPLIYTAIRNVLQSATISGANTGSKFPGSVTGVLLDPDNLSTQTAGTVLWSRSKNSVNPPTFQFGATSSGVVYGTDQL